MSDRREREHDPKRPFRFPELQGERFERALKARREEDPHAKARSEHGLIPEEVRELEDGAVEEVYADGHVERYSAEEVKAYEERAQRREADELLVHGPPAKTLQEAIRIEHIPVPWDVPSLAEEEMLVGASTLLDHLDDLGEEAQDELCRLLGEYGSARWGMLPCFEVYKTPVDEGWTGKRVLGYRLNAFEACVLPARAYDRHEDKDCAWSSDAGLGYLDRITEILCDTSDESIDDTRLLCERGPTMGFWYVKNGRLYGKRDWPALRHAVDEGHGTVWRPVPEQLSPVLVASPYSVEAKTVAALVEGAKRAMYRDEEDAAREGDDLLSDEYIAAMERLEEGSALASWQLERVRRKRQGRDRVQEVWAALLELDREGRALLPAWDHPYAWDELILLRQSPAGLSEQISGYALLHPELELAPPQREKGRFEEEPKEPSDPRGSAYLFQHFAREAWEDPRYWWTSVDAEALAAVRGQWVALDQFRDVLAQGPDPEALKSTSGWRHIVSVPEEGYEEGLVITNPEPVAEEELG